MNSIFKFLLVGVLLIVLFFVILIPINSFQIVNHEEIHQNIFKDYGCESEIEYGRFKLWGITRSKCPQSELMDLQHNMNDIVGYNVVVLILMFSLIALLLFVMIIQNIVIQNKISEVRQ